MATKPALANPFPHLSLPLIVRDRARLQGGGRSTDRETANKNARVAHSAYLTTAAAMSTAVWGTRRDQRLQLNLPPIPADIPLFVKVEPGSDIEFLRKNFKFEIVSEHDDGLIIVASEEVDLATLVEKANHFALGQHGSATAAKIYELIGPENTPLRLERLLSESLLQKWDTITDVGVYTVEVGIECLGPGNIRDLAEQRPEESDARYLARLERWRAELRVVESAWDDLMAEREAELSRFVYAYGGEILDILHNMHVGAAVLPDSFTVRIRLHGLALRDLVLNFPYLFEVSEPDEIAGIIAQPGRNPLPSQPEIQSADADAPRVCVIDSGIQEQHPLLSAVVDTESSACFIPGVDENDVADYVRPGGHGTRVAGAIVFPGGAPVDGVFKAACWIQNARVLDGNNQLPLALHPPTYLKAIVERYHFGDGQTKLFNHSIAAYRPCRRRNMSAWAATMDWLSWEYDVLFFQSAGNLPPNSSALPFRMGILDHLHSGTPYPDYLTRDSSRIPSPSESLQALTVGSVSYDGYMVDGQASFGGEDWPSAFSSTGLGVWKSIKPDVVEYGGDYVRDGHTPPGLTTPAEVCPDLVRSTMYGGPVNAKDGIGTSFAAPKVASIAVALQTLLPDEPALLYRALIVNSARWPTWAENSHDKLSALRQIGFGIPDLARATSNTEFRVTLISNGEHRVRSKEAHIFQVPIPAALRSPGDDFNIRIDVTLSYVAKPRRTRRQIRKYLSTWVDWKSSNLGESVGSFKKRVLRDGGDALADGESLIPWAIREQDDYGSIIGVRRGTGTIQKDWAVIKSHDLPTDFCVAVIGHPGWDTDPDAFAKFTLTVSFEAVDEDISIYEQIAAAVEALVPVPEIEMEVSA